MRGSTAPRRNDYRPPRFPTRRPCCVSGEIKEEGIHRSAKPQPPEVDTAKPTAKLSGHDPRAGRDYMIGDNPQHRIIGSVLLRPF